jgi:DNA-binding MarR family transcriptional regulator
MSRSMVKEGRPRGSSIPEDEKAAANALHSAIACFQQLEHTMPAQYIQTFLLVAMEQGLSVRDYAERSDVSASVMSRHLLDIGERNRHMQPGWGLVTYRPNPLELRKLEHWLTPKGRCSYTQSLGIGGAPAAFLMAPRPRSRKE